MSSATGSATPTPPTVEVGQRWRSLDPRDKGLVVTVLHVAEWRGIKIQRFRKTWVDADRFVRNYEFVSPVADLRKHAANSGEDSTTRKGTGSR